MLSDCAICPRGCHVDRSLGGLGSCGIGDGFNISSICAHRGEEPPISGTNGSGTIFLTGCSMHCIYCQNYPISQQGAGRKVSNGEIRSLMLDLQRRGAHNINFVTPTHFAPQLV